VEGFLPKLLDWVPDVWGPKFGVNGAAVTTTRAGPNEIGFKAPAHLALVMFTPQPRREVALNSDRRTVFSAPVGALEIVPADAEFFAFWQVAKQNLLMTFDPSRLAGIAGAEFDREDFEFRPPALGAIDKKAMVLANLIREEFQYGQALNALCVESLMTLFAMHLLRTHSSFSDRSRGPMRGGLSAKTLRSVTEFIAANLSEDLSIGRLADLAGLSPSHFLRAFRQTLGQAPHQYVLAQRLALVERLATTTDAPLMAVAGAAGFSNPSHMTAALKRARGLTPTELRREEKRLWVRGEMH
jgi:AraC family transcriptional regulator